MLSYLALAQDTGFRRTLPLEGAVVRVPFIGATWTGNTEAGGQANDECGFVSFLSGAKEVTSSKPGLVIAGTVLLLGCFPPNITKLFKYPLDFHLH